MTQRIERAALAPGLGSVASGSIAQTLDQLFAQQVARTPDAVAVLDDRGESLTYGQLHERSDRLAALLRRHGAGPDVLVGVLMHRSAQLVVALYAVIKSGAAYVPLDPDYPTDRIDFMFADAQAPVLVTEVDLASRVRSGSGVVLALDEPDLATALASGPRPDVQPSAAPDDLAYVIYTSGSTGKPKGVMVSHSAICNRLLWMQDEYCLSADDRVLQKTPFSFDVSVWELFWPLLVGAALVVARPGGHRDSAYIVDVVQRERITTTHFVPSMLRLFLDDPRADRCLTLRRVFCSGEALPRALQDRFFELLDVELHNLYGPTEAAVDVTYWACRRDSPLTVVPIGHPVANTRVHLLDGDGREVEAGGVGRLFIGGVQVARGYLRRPELTAEKFVADPFSDEPGARLYDTGDLARRLPDGALEFLGRTDHQVKLRGLRVELGEIEAALDAQDGVGQSVVTAPLDHAGDQRLVAYVVPRPGVQHAPTAQELRRQLALALPDYMVPAHIVELPAFPLSPSGKVDRARLPLPDLVHPAGRTGSAPPRDAVEKYVATMWGELLGIADVGRSDRFFDLGGTSLQAARFTNRLQVELGEPVFVVSLFSAPTVADFAAFLRSDYAGPLAALLGEPRPPATAEPLHSIVTAESLQRFTALVPRLGQALPSPPSDRNPPAVFILSPPRSGTTLLRVMLAGHPDLFAASELQLLGFQTLAQREAAYTGRFSLWLDGTVRALMELMGVDATEARAVMERAVREGRTTQQFYRQLQELAAPRTLVDKSPSYALDRGALDKAESDFDSPLYIHLVRHPTAVIRSFEKHHLDQALYLRDHKLGRRELAEMVWTASHRVVVDFLDEVPAHRWHRAHFEEMVTRPRVELERLCLGLGLPFDEGVVHPYDGLSSKMTDGVLPESRPMGDTRFLEHARIRPEAAQSWRGSRDELVLGEPTVAMAAALGYPVEDLVDANDRRPVAATRRQSLVSRRGRRPDRGQVDG